MSVIKMISELGLFQNKFFVSMIQLGKGRDIMSLQKMMPKNMMFIWIKIDFI